MDAQTRRWNVSCRSIKYIKGCPSEMEGQRAPLTFDERNLVASQNHHYSASCSTVHLEEVLVMSLVLM